MTEGKVSRAVVALAALLSSAAAVPFAPGLMGMYGGFGPPGIHPGFGPKIGNSYRCVGGIGHCPDIDDVDLVYEPDMLVALSRYSNALDEVTGLKAIIKEEEVDSDKPGHGGMFGGHHGLLGFGGFGGYGGYGGHGGRGGYPGYGGFGGFGGQRQEETKLNLNLEVTASNLNEPIEVMLVFTAASDPDYCNEETVGPVLTRPDKDYPDVGHQGLGYGAGPMMLSMPHYAGNEELDFGVISTLTIKNGVNTFQISGLGDFKRLKHLAGRGVGLCHDVTISSRGKPMCSGDTSKVFMCGRLGYSITSPSLVQA